MALRVPPMHIYLLGTPEIRRNGRPLLIRRRLVRALLYYLAAHHGGVSRDRLAYMFAPDKPQKAARRQVSHLLWHLRHALGPEGMLCVRAKVETVSLSFDCWVDVRVFDQTTRAVEQWDQLKAIPANTVRAVANALSLYRGEFLSGFSLPHHQELEEWVLLQREHLNRLYLDALVALAHVHITRKAWKEAIGYARRALIINPLREDTHRVLMLLYAVTGQREAALDQYGKCAFLLRRELGIEPSPDTTAIYQAIRENRLPPFPAHSSPLLLDTTLRRVKREPFVGRTRHLQRLEALWRNVREGKGQAVFLWGDAGIGKTRLVHEFVRRTQVLLLEGRADASMASAPYYPLISALRQFLSYLPWSDLEFSSEVLSEVSRLLPEVRFHCPNIPAPLPPDPIAGQARMYEALFRFLQQISTQPYLLFIDDAHWAADMLWNWFSFLLPRLNKLPVLLVFAYRPEEATPIFRMFARRAQAEGWGTMMALRGLSREEVVHLVRYLRRHHHPPPVVLAQYLYKLTGGNPLFLLETIRWLEEHRQASGEIPIPERVREILAYRIGLFPPLTRRLLNAAAVLSPHLQVDVLAKVTGCTEEEIVETLQELVSRGIIVPDLHDGITYQFSHEQLRGTVYEMMGPVRRRHLHRRAAQVLQATRPANIQSLGAMLAYHWQKAGEPAQAVRAIILTMEQAANQFAYEHVISLAEKALALIPNMPPGPERWRAEMAIYLQRGRAYKVQRQYERARPDLVKAQRLGEILGNISLAIEALEARIDIAVDCWHMEEARSLGDLCLQMALRQKERSLLGRALYLRAFVAVHTGEEIDDAEIVQALNIFTQTDDHIAMAKVWNLRGVRDMMAGAYPSALQALEVALGLASEVRHYFLMHRVQANRGHVLYDLGDFRGAWQAFVHAEEWLQAIGLQRPDLLYDIGRGYVALHLGHSTEAEQFLTRALALADIMTSSQGRVTAHVHLAYLRALQGRIEEALTLLTEALSFERKVYIGTYIMTLSVYGAVLRLQGRFTEALAAHRRALRMARTIPHERHTLNLLCEAGWDLLSLNRIQAATRLFAFALKRASRGSGHVETVRALTGLAAACVGDIKLAHRALEEAQRTGSLLLYAHAVEATIPTFLKKQQFTQAQALEGRICTRLQKAGWQTLLTRLHSAKAVTFRHPPCSSLVPSNIPKST